MDDNKKPEEQVNSASPELQQADLEKVTGGASAGGGTTGIVSAAVEAIRRLPTGTGE